MNWISLELGDSGIASINLTFWWSDFWFVGCRVSIRLIRCGSGLNFAGIESHVFLPIITVFCWSVADELMWNAPLESTVNPCVVSFLNQFMSALRDFGCHGRFPWNPIPSLEVLATTRASGAIQTGYSMDELEQEASELQHKISTFSLESNTDSTHDQLSIVQTKVLDEIIPAISSIRHANSCFQQELKDISSNITKYHTLKSNISACLEFLGNYHKLHS